MLSPPALGAPAPPGVTGVPGAEEDKRRSQAETPNLLDALRQKTARAHDALHHNPLLAPMAEGTLTTDTYKILMARFHGFYLGLDPLLIRASAALADELDGFHYQPRSPFFADDLTALGVSPATVAVCQAHPPINTVGAFAGAVYVIEGATLGGSILERAAARTVPAEARTYWSWCRRHCASQWRTTRRLLDRLDDGQRLDAPSQHAAVLATAEAIFAAMGQWFDGANPPAEVRRCD